MLYYAYVRYVHHSFSDGIRVSDCTVVRAEDLNGFFQKILRKEKLEGSEGCDPAI
jgi:hypothetical protein